MGNSQPLLVHRSRLHSIMGDCFSANCCFMGIVGVGVGTYNSHHMKECLDDTFHVGAKSAKKAKEKAAENPSLQRGMSAAGEKFNQARDGVTPYMQAAKEKSQRAMSGMSAKRYLEV